MQAVLTLHARQRLCERTSLTEEEFVRILDLYLTVSVGYETEAKRWHRLFYSAKDDVHLVAIQDLANGEVITILPLDYHENLAWKISRKALAKAVWKIDRRKHEELYMESPKAAPGQRMEMTAVVWNDCHQSRKHCLGKYRFPEAFDAVDDVLEDDQFVATILDHMKQRNLSLARIDEILLFDPKADLLITIPWHRIAEFSFSKNSAN